MGYQFRPATTHDLHYCRQVHHQGMRPYVEALWGWKQEFQDRRFDQKFNPTNVSIITLANQDVGYLEIVERGEVLTLANLIISDEFQNKGIGSSVLRDLIEQSRKRLTKVTLNVLSNNPSKNLYTRLGFQTTSEHDDLVTMELVL